MAVFSGLSEKINHVFNKLTNKGHLTELEIKQAMREVIIALLEADVNLKVVKKFIADRPKLQMPAKILMIPSNAVMLIMNTALLVGMSYNPFLYYKF